MTIQFNVSFPDPHTHYTYIKMTINKIDQQSIKVGMPVWTPGSYLLREYSQHIDQFEVLDNNKQALSFDKIRKNIWEINTAGRSKLVINYRFYAFEATVRTNFVDVEHAALNGAATFLYVEDHLDIPITIKFRPFKQWKKIATSLKKVKDDDWTRMAENYDEIVDSPVEIGNFESFAFKAGGVPHQVAIYGVNNGNNKTFVKDLEKVCQVATDIMGGHPCKEFLFIIHNTESRYNGLEHSNSTVCQVPRWDYYPNEKYCRTMGLMSHEYFHLWNVKRIRPEVLGPFDYNNENYTKQLWVVEGITSYYDDYILLKSEIFTRKEYLDTLSKNLNSVVNNPGDDTQSLTEASYDAWIKYYRQNENSLNNSVSYYVKGSLVALVLNFIILHETDGERSLTDVMRQLFKDYQNNPTQGFSESDFLNTVNTIAGKKLNKFFEKHIYGKEAVNFEKYFAYVGLTLKNKEKDKAKTELGIVASWEEEKLIIKKLDKNYGGYLGGLNVNDEIIAIDDFRVFKDYEKILEQKKAGSNVKVLVSRGGLMKEIEIPVTQSKRVAYEIVERERPSAKAKKLREIWLSK
ncbi:MAG: M61 family metallopeptidase [Bacteroidetes bacterium]|nr:M61 family metallopeptidase [Bacteroidota bacterium]